MSVSYIITIPVSKLSSISHLNVNPSSKANVANIKSLNSSKIQFQSIFYFSISDLPKVLMKIKTDTPVSFIPYVPFIPYVKQKGK